MDTSKIRVIFEYEFRRGTNAADAISMLRDEPRGRPPTQVNNNELKEMVEADPSRTTQELAASFNVTFPTILTHLRQIT
ncbi:unnamed protein product [Euphydryas editha]|uniref:HTH_48 domain-containing protein n=1 Tax=Euphydryas editha TaxID=104508 RepID=A0AAU9V7R1_EUPED|nr:unnamed protein product [Euphydryas editha]